MDAHFFAGLDGGPRSQKPRTNGLTMVIDWGLGSHAQEDLLETGADYVDLAKVAVGVSRLLSREVLQQKIERYQEHGVEPFPGGQFLEYAEVQGQIEGYLPACVEAGYRWIEVSDNLVSVELSWKEQMIRSAVDEHGLRVLGEIGKKEGLDKGASLVEDARACVGAGAELVLVEAAELMSGDEAVEREVEAVVEAIGIENVMFELPGPWIEGVAHYQIHQMRRELIGRYGAEVNLGNVAADELVSSEGLRRGLGVNAGGMD